MKVPRAAHSKLCWLFLVLLCLHLTLGPGCEAFKIRSGSRIAAKHRQIDWGNDDEDEDSTEIGQNEDDEDEDEDRMTSVEDLDDDDDDDDDEDEDTWEPRAKTVKLGNTVFAKVRRAHFDVASRKVRQSARISDTSDKTEAKRVPESRSIVSSVLSWFGQNNEPSEVDEPREEPAPKQVVEKKPAASEEPPRKKGRSRKGFLKQYLDKLPLGFLRDFISDGQSKEQDDDEPEVSFELPKLLKPTAQIVEDVMKSVKEKVQAKSAPKKKRPQPPIPHEEFEKLLMNIPSFVPNYTRIHNFECRMQGEIFERQLKGHKSWTLQMIDSSAKITSGLMRGNMNQLGDFDMCTGIATKVKVTQNDAVNIRGKYCLAHIDVTAFEDGLKGPLHLIQGKGLIKSSLEDPVHFIPRFSTANWGLCVPAACIHEDVEKVLNNFLKPYNGTGLRIQVEVDEENCYVQQPRNYRKLIEQNWQIPATLLFYTFCIVATGVATLSDYSESMKGGVIGKFVTGTTKDNGGKKNDEKITEKQANNGIVHQILMAFSLKSTLPLLFRSDGTEEEQIGCIHGVKAIGSMLLFVAFRAIPLGRTPFTNRNELTDLFNSRLSMLVRALFLYTDLFLFLSGLLCAYGVVKDVKSNGKVYLFRRIIGRVVRLVPTLLAVLLFYAYVWEYIGNGPQWGDVVVKNAELCRENMWKNLLFIQNWLPFEQICATHTYQLAIDMQLFLLTPLLVWLFYKNPLIGLGAYGILHGFSTGARFTSVADDRLSFVLFHGMKLSQIYRTANKALSQTVHRASPYLIGIGLGVALRDLEKSIKIPRPVSLLAWITSFLGLFWCFWSPSHLADNSYQYESSFAAHYAALSSIVFPLSLAWIVFACNYGYGGLFNSLLCSKISTFLSRISYSMYLIEFIVFFTFVGRQRHTEHFSLSSYLDTQELLVLLGASLGLTLLIDLPMQNIRRIILGSSPTEVLPSPEKVVKKEEVNGSKPVPVVEKEPEPDFVSPWDDVKEEEEAPPRFEFTRRASAGSAEKRPMSPREYFKSDFAEGSNPWNSHSNEQSIEYDADEVESEEEEEEESEEEEERPLSPPKPEPEPELEIEPIRPARRTLATRRWQMDLQED